MQPHTALELDTQGEHRPAYEPPLFGEEESWKQSLHRTLERESRGPGVLHKVRDYVTTLFKVET